MTKDQVRDGSGAKTGACARLDPIVFTIKANTMNFAKRIHRTFVVTDARFGISAALNHAAGQAAARVTGGLTFIIIGFFVDHQRGPART